MIEKNRSQEERLKELSTVTLQLRDRATWPLELNGESAGLENHPTPDQMQEEKKESARARKCDVAQWDNKPNPGVLRASRALPSSA